MRNLSSSSQSRSAIVIAFISLVVSVSGVSWAASKIGTADLKSGAVTTKKLHKRAVSAGKISSGAVATGKLVDGAVTSDKLASRVSGLALAGVVVGGGQVDAWFNRLGGEPSARRSSEGNYTISIPGFDEVPFATAIQSATIDDTRGGEIVVRAVSPSASAPIPVVRTFDSAGNPEDRNFFYTVFEGTLAGSD